MQPQTTDADLIRAVNLLDSLRHQIAIGTITFDEAALKYSDDEDTRNNGGLLINAETNTTKLSPDKIERMLFFQVDSMLINSVSAPLPMQTAEGKSAYRIVVVKSRTKPHKANLKEDYQKIQEVALQQKQNKTLSEWVVKKQKTTYVQINEEYSSCEMLESWKLTSLKKSQ